MILLKKLESRGNRKLVIRTIQTISILSYLWITLRRTRQIHISMKSKIDYGVVIHSIPNPCRNSMKKILSLVGNFCCAECAAAYNFDSRLSGDEMWERYSLLNMIYSGDGREIKMALPRLSLKKFGGPFSVEQFRRHNPSKNFKITMPPTSNLFLLLRKLQLIVIIHFSMVVALISLTKLVMNCVSRGQSLFLIIGIPLRIV